MCNWLDLETLGSRPIIAQKSPQTLLPSVCGHGHKVGEGLD
jgi:hypothetical protein